MIQLVFRLLLVIERCMYNYCDTYTPWNVMVLLECRRDCKDIQCARKEFLHLQYSFKTIHFYTRIIYTICYSFVLHTRRENKSEIRDNDFVYYSMDVRM